MGNYFGRLTALVLLFFSLSIFAAAPVSPRPGEIMESSDQESAALAIDTAGDDHSRTPSSDDSCHKKSCACDCDHSDKEGFNCGKRPDTSQKPANNK